MDQEIALFIGGPCDGQRREVYAGQSRVEVAILPVRSTLDIKRDPNPPREAIAYDSATYDRYPVRSPQGTDTAVYVWGDIDPLAAMIDRYPKADAGKRKQIEGLERHDAHIHACLAALRMGRIDSYQGALEEMVIMLAEKSAMYERQFMQLRGTLLRDITSPLGVFTGEGGKPHKPDPL